MQYENNMEITITTTLINQTTCYSWNHIAIWKQYENNLNNYISKTVGLSKMSYCSAWPKLKTKIGLHPPTAPSPPYPLTQTFWHVPGIVGDQNSVYSIRITQINNFLKKNNLPPPPPKKKNLSEKNWIVTNCLKWHENWSTIIFECLDRSPPPPQKKNKWGGIFGQK